MQYPSCPLQLGPLSPLQGRSCLASKSRQQQLEGLQCHSLDTWLAHLKFGRGSVEVSILLRFPFFLLVNECAAREVFCKNSIKSVVKAFHDSNSNGHLLSPSPSI